MRGARERAIMRGLNSAHTWKIVINSTVTLTPMPMTTDACELGRHQRLFVVHRAKLSVCNSLSIVRILNTSEHILVVPNSSLDYAYVGSDNHFARACCNK